jgi:phytoene/squalene synthetase
MYSIPIPNSPQGQGGKIDLAASITKAGSKQTFYTFKHLADRDRVEDAFKAYAYFRWLDDLLDCSSGTKPEKSALIERQQAFLEACYRREALGYASPEEQMLVELIGNDHEEHSGLQIYLRNMMQVMVFDVERCGRLISHIELNEYTRLLSTAVTELMFYLFDHRDAPTCTETRYHAVYGAHIVHMLRDTVEDISAGYFNIPREYLGAGKINLDQLHSLPMRTWVFERVKLARQYFRLGRRYIAQVRNFRCRIAGFAYIARFEWMLRAIERDQYCLRREYPERKSLKALLWMVSRVFTSSVNLRWMRGGFGKQPGLTGQCGEG